MTGAGKTAAGAIHEALSKQGKLCYNNCQGGCLGSYFLGGGLNGHACGTGA